MNGRIPLDAFVVALGPDATSIERTQLSERLEDCQRRGEAAWPDVDLDQDDFAEHLGALCTQVEDLNSLAIEDLFLARACANGHVGAIEALHDHIADQVQQALRRLGLTNDEAADIRMSVIERLIVDDPPKIASYGGRGSLSQWVAIAAAREAMSLKRTEARRRDLLEAAMEDLAPQDPELAFLKSHYRAEFRSAFGEAISGLEPEDRAVLVYRFVDGLTLEQLAVAAGVHRATAARWLARIRQTLLHSTREGLKGRLGVGDEDLDSIMQLIASNFEVSIRRMLER